MNYPETENEQEYGTMDLVNDVLLKSKESNYFIIKNLGVVSLGNTIKTAGEMIVSAHETALRLGI